MQIKLLFVAAAITLTPIAAIAQGASSAGQYPAPGAGRNDSSSDATSSTNRASNTANCMPGNSTSAQRSASNSAMNNNSSSNAMGNSANCTRGSSSMTNRSDTTTNSSGR